VGATDQHSQVQLFMEGPFDKVITFAVVDDLGDDIRLAPISEVPGAAPLPPDLSYLVGHTLGELLRAEYEATATALAQHGRMSCTLRLPDLSATTFGEAVMLYQIATGYAGVWYGVNPFDQPGVELGKKLTYAAMGRPGYAAADKVAEQDRDVA
jgi:glucose-6-phosphate isomerase